jgi:hypothetical protein
MDESAMMAQQIESESQAGEASAQRYSAVEEQVLQPPAAISAASHGILNAHTETSFAHKRRQSQAAHERAHAHKSISQQRDAAIDHKSIDPIGGHPATDARLRFQHKRVETAVLQPESRRKSRDPSANHDYVSVSALRPHEDSP